MELVAGFTEALYHEIESLKKGKGGNSVTIFNGTLVKESENEYVYRFNLSDILHVIEDSPAIIESSGIEFNCTIVAINRNEIQCELEEPLPEKIKIARIKTSAWFLLESLKRKFEKKITEDTGFFKNSEALFSGISSIIDKGTIKPIFDRQKFQPNIFQIDAIESSLNESISIIWGPPGTGKTETIAYAVENHLNVGRRVLLLSHSNNAVDQALKKVAENLKGSYYTRGQLLRHGHPREEMLREIKERYPLVLIENILPLRSEQVISEYNSVKQDIESIELSKKIEKELFPLKQKISSTKVKQLKLVKTIKNLQNDVDQLINSIIELEDKIKSKENKYQKAKGSSGFRKLLNWQTPEKILSEINNDQLKINEINIKKVELEHLILLNENEKSNILDELYHTEKETELKILSCFPSVDFYDKISRIDKNGVRELKTKQNQLYKEISSEKSIVLKEAKFVATTLSKFYLTKEFEDSSFDILILDEASMAPMPMIYWARSFILKGITIVGDFLQLPPIASSEHQSVKEWLSRSIFDHLGVDHLVNEGNQRVKMLSIQYRMNPEISAIINNLFYKNRLKDHESVLLKSYKDNISGNKATCLIDTSQLNPYLSQIEQGGRFNLINALTCAILAKELTEQIADGATIGILTPYRQQAQLINRFAQQIGLVEDKIYRINTIHSFQGGEETVIIFDTVESEGGRKWSMLNEHEKENTNAKLLLNVALSRAKSKLYIISNNEYFRKNFKPESLVNQLINHISKNGTCVSASRMLMKPILESMKEDSSKVELAKTNAEEYANSRFWSAFIKDIKDTREEVIIFASNKLIKPNRRFFEIFQDLTAKHIRVYLITDTPGRSDNNYNTWLIQMKSLANWGITLKFVPRKFERIVIIDKKISYIGNLNLLSSETGKYIMERILGNESAQKIIELFKLDELLDEANKNGTLCPKCKKNFIVERLNKFENRNFYGCSGYDDKTVNCDYTEGKQFTSKKQNQKILSSKPHKLHSNIELSKKVNPLKKEEWESQTLYWSSVEKPGYQYSAKKNAWWKKKD